MSAIGKSSRACRRCAFCRAAKAFPAAYRSFRCFGPGALSGRTAAFCSCVPRCEHPVRNLVLFFLPEELKEADGDQKGTENLFEQRRVQRG